MSSILYDYCKDRGLSVKLQDIPMLRYFFDGIHVYIHEVPMFTRGDFVYVGTKDIDKKCKHVFLSLGVGQDLFSKEVFIPILEKRFLIKKKYLKYLDSVEGEEFWGSVKLLLCGVKLDTLIDKSTGSLFDLFDVLFSEYGKVYSVYRKLNIPYKVLFSGLLSLFLKIKNVKDDKEYIKNPRYLQKLKDMYSKISYIESAVMFYIESDMSELSFMNMLRMLSRD